MKTLFALILTLCSTAQAATLLTLNPVGGAISGSAGQTIGWGFTFFNDTNYALIVRSEWVTTTSLGDYTDFVSVFGSVVGPSPENSAFSQIFDADPAIETGAGKLVLATSLTPGAHVEGIIQFTYDLFSVSLNDQNFNPDTDTISTGNVVSAVASVDVIETPDAAVPEPSLGFLMAAIAAINIALQGRTREVIENKQ